MVIKAEELSEQAQRHRHLALIRAVRAYQRGHGSLWAVAAAQRETRRYEKMKARSIKE